MPYNINNNYATPFLANARSSNQFESALTIGKNDNIELNNRNHHLAPGSFEGGGVSIFPTFPKSPFDPTGQSANASSHNLGITKVTGMANSKYDSLAETGILQNGGKLSAKNKSDTPLVRSPPPWTLAKDILNALVKQHDRREKLGKNSKSRKLRKRTRHKKRKLRKHTKHNNRNGSKLNILKKRNRLRKTKKRISK